MKPTGESHQPSVEDELFKVLDLAFDKVASETPDMMFDPKGKRAYVVVAFNHPTDPALLPEDASPDDALVAISAVTLTCMPYVESTLDEPVTPSACLAHGVQAVAASMLSGLLKSQAVAYVLNVAQGAMLDRRRNTND